MSAHLAETTPMVCYPFATATASTRVLETGAGTEHVILLHGLGARADRWRANLEALAGAGLHAYAVDFPGHGFADKGPDLPHTVPALAEWVLDLMDRLEIDSAHVVGTSLGGHVAARLALDAPNRVRSIVLVGPMGIVPVGPAGREALARAVVDTSRPGIRRKLENLVQDQSLVTDRWVLEEWRINNSGGAGTALARYADYFAELIDDDVVGAELRDLDPARVMLMWGDSDVLVPISLAPAVHAQLPDRCQFITIEAAGHAPYLERAEVVNQDLIAFLSAVPPQLLPEGVGRAQHTAAVAREA
ncbi:alpha/beta fold hydrolase [Pseudonocardia kujensis]|uniref:alpha/beta fold hydrolase n=1 Tax=Pseudonocardia kujensis TaxID=1128675 RepID=UPI001E2A9F0B|nr:alpha/beta fold hydrolase [Pseudonocardia kujensis]MCE0767387.1 alpha/beta fold hydrolase [Pseudonocardia kujensis]